MRAVRFDLHLQLSSWFHRLSREQVFSSSGSNLSRDCQPGLRLTQQAAPMQQDMMIVYVPFAWY